MTRHGVLLVALFASVSLATGQESRPGGAMPPFSPVTWERLVNAADEPHNWLMYSGTLDSQRFSRLDEIDTGNVANLELKWAHYIPTLDRSETTPVHLAGAPVAVGVPDEVVAVETDRIGSLSQRPSPCSTKTGGPRAEQ